MKKLLPYVALALAVVALFFALRSCGGPDERYWIAKATYDQRVKDAAAQHVTDMGTIDTQKGTIAEKNAAIAEKDAKVTQYVDKVSTLTAELRALQNAEPVQPELESQPLVINLRAQVGNLTRMASISINIIAEKDAIIADWTAKFDAQVTISETYKTAYDREHGLRLTSDALRLDLEKQLYGGKFWKALAIGEPIVFAAITILKK